MNIDNQPVDGRIGTSLLAGSVVYRLLDTCTNRNDIPVAHRLGVLHRAARLLISVHLRDLGDLPKLRRAVALHLLYPAILSDGLSIAGQTLETVPRSMLAADEDHMAEQWLQRALQISFASLPTAKANRDATHALTDDLQELMEWTHAPQPKTLLPQ